MCELIGLQIIQVNRAAPDCHTTTSMLLVRCSLSLKGFTHSSILCHQSKSIFPKILGIIIYFEQCKMGFFLLTSWMS